jgi:endonuclease-3
MAQRRRDPFRVLVATLISLRTKDEVTREAAERLLARAPDPARLATLPVREIQRLIYPAGFYRTKARTLKEVARRLLRHWNGRVPAELEALLSLPGVGRKTANLVLVEGFGKPAVAVDTHVHRITNRLGVLATKHPDETEEVLRRILPRRRWVRINELLVSFGQRVCRPLSPHCSRCPVRAHCLRVGVTRHR